MTLDLNMPIRNAVRLFVLAIWLCMSHSLISQEESSVERSRIIETLEGKEYYLHFIKDGETLFSIARTYNTTVNDIFRNNPESREGIRAGMILRIPLEETKTAEPVITSEPSDNFYYHIVKKQETLFSISEKYGVTVQAIKDINPQMGAYLKEGETLKVPRIKESTISQDVKNYNTHRHTIEAGETLYSIARKYSVPTGVIMNANPGVSPESLTIGQYLTIPEPPSRIKEPEVNSDTTAQFREHIVSKGETLYSISRQYGVVIDTLKKYNAGLEYRLYVGQKIKIPVTSQDVEFIVYTPDKAERIDQIAEKHQIESEELDLLNPEIGRKAKKGQPVMIPVESAEDTDDAVPDFAEDPVQSESPCVGWESSTEMTINVALMLPLFLESADSVFKAKESDYSNLTNLNSFRFLPFYSGFLMAVDSMKNQGLNINLFVYDVDNTEQKVNAVLNKSELGRMDLIVGPLYALSFTQVASFAKNHKIPIINPLSTREEIIQNNPYVFKLKPSTDVQTDLLLDHILRKYSKSNVVLIRHNKYQFQEPVSFLRNNLNSRRADRVGIPNSQVIKIMSQGNKRNLFTENKMIDFEKINRSPKDTTYFSNYIKEAIYVNDSTIGLKMSLSLARHNLVIAFSEDIVFSKQILSQLNKLSQDYDITLFGVPEWHAYADLESSHLLNLSLHSFSGSLVDYKDEHTKKWVEQYRQKFNSDPTVSNYAFDGFDTGWYFMNALNRFGKNFYHCLDDLKIPLIQSRFQFEHTNPNGYRNVYWNLGKFEDHQFKKVNLY
jgi:LysM repeat protein